MSESGCFRSALRIQQTEAWLWIGSGALGCLVRAPDRSSDKLRSFIACWQRTMHLRWYRRKADKTQNSIPCRLGAGWCNCLLVSVCRKRVCGNFSCLTNATIWPPQALPSLPVSVYSPLLLTHSLGHNYKRNLLKRSQKYSFGLCYFYSSSRCVAKSGPAHGHQLKVDLQF